MSPLPYLLLAIGSFIIGGGAIGLGLVAAWFVASVLGAWLIPRRKADGRFLPEVLD